MNRYPRIGETVRIINDIGVALNSDRIGTVESRDGEYILVRLDKSGVLCDCYLCELDPVEDHGARGTHIPL